LKYENFNHSSRQTEREIPYCSLFFVSGISHISFVIGGSLGLDEQLIKSADLRLSLSNMTFPHQLTRLILLEQLFRAFKIINGEPYHK